MKNSIGAASLLIILIYGTSASSDSLVQCWGNNAEGQTDVPADLGLSPSFSGKPQEVHTGRGVTCALVNGSISCWGVVAPGFSRLTALKGVKTFGVSQVGACALTSAGVQCFSSVDDPTLENVPHLTNPRSVVVGGSFACAIDDHGVSCWGESARVLRQIPSFTNPRKIVASVLGACALDDIGLQCWGDSNLPSVPGFYGATDFVLGASYVCGMGSGGLQCAGAPAPSTLPPWKAGASLVSGALHLCSLDAQGVHCTGDDSESEIEVPALAHPQAIFADATGAQTCAIDDSGLVCWGEDQAGQSSLGPVSSLSAGMYNTCVAARGKVRCWGGQSTAIDAALGLGDGYQVAAGSNFACAADFRTIARSACWGDSSSLLSVSPPLPIIDFSFLVGSNAPVALLAAGYNHACVNNSDSQGGVINCFGNNDYGQAAAPAGFTAAGNLGSLALGGNHSCGIDANSNLQCWGANEFGESTVPPTLQKPRLVTAGFYHTCALDSVGVTCWGRESEGQTTVPALHHPRLIQAGGYHTCAVDDDGVKCWGDNSYGQSTPPAAWTNGSARITTLATGMFHTCAAMK